MNPNPKGSTPSPSAPSGGQNVEGAAKADPRAVLAAMVAQRESPAPVATEDSPTPSAQDDPETPAVPATEEQPGQDDLPPEETPPGEETPQPEGEPETVLSQPDAEITQLLEGLDDSQRGQLQEMLKDVKDGKANWGDIKRGHKLTEQINALKSEFQAEIEKLKGSQAEAETPASHDPAVPETVARLKTVKEVEARLEVAQRNYEALQDFLDTNPGSAEAVYDINSGAVVEAEPDGKRFFSRQQLVDRRAQWRQEMRLLPQKAQAIQQTEAFRQQQQTARTEVVKQFPYLADAEHATTKAVTAKLKEAPFLNSFASPEYAALLWVKGEAALQAEIAARKAGKVVAKPAGKVPLGKPHTAAGAAPARGTSATMNAEGAMSKLKKEGSLSSFAELLSATGR